MFKGCSEVSEEEAEAGSGRGDRRRDQEEIRPRSTDHGRALHVHSEKPLMGLS